MFIEFVRNDVYITSLHKVLGYIYVGEVRYYSLKKSWGESCDDIFETSSKIKALQVTENFITKYLKESTYADMLTQESSWYFDYENQLIYIHMKHTENPLTAVYDYGYAFGVTDNEVTYINDVEYLPLIKESPDIDRESDYTNSDQPTGSTGSITLANMEYRNDSGEKEGRLDFLLNENIYGNDVFFYMLSDGQLKPIASKYVEDITIGMQEVSIQLQDRRFS